MTSNIREIIDIFISAHIYDHDMLDEFLSKCFESGTNIIKLLFTYVVLAIGLGRILFWPDTGYPADL